MATMNSSISSSNQWRTFTLTLFGVSLGGVSLLYLFIVIVDPYDNLPISPNWQREQVSGTDRYFKPAVARRSHYDSVIIGTSSVMLIHPLRLNQSLNARFASLAMPAASPFEQLRLLSLFSLHHSKINYVIVGMDEVWCQPNGSAKQLGALVGNIIPDWLYDENRWNDWPTLNGEMLKYSRRQFKVLINFSEDSAGYDGYYDFTKNYPSYDIHRARNMLYGRTEPIPTPRYPKNLQIAAGKREGWEFPDLNNLKQRLASLPENTAKILVFVPYHWYKQPHSGTIEQVYLAECKRRVAAWSSRIKNYTVIDFMRHSTITLTDSNYWDSVHYTYEIAEYIEGVISATMGDSRIAKEGYVYLALPRLK